MSKENKNKLQNKEILIIHSLIIIGKSPFSFVIQVKKANIGDKKANIVHPLMNVQP